MGHGVMTLLLVLGKETSNCTLQINNQIGKSTSSTKNCSFSLPTTIWWEEVHHRHLHFWPVDHLELDCLKHQISTSDPCVECERLSQQKEALSGWGSPTWWPDIATVGLFDYSHVDQGLKYKLNHIFWLSTTTHGAILSRAENMWRNSPCNLRSSMT